MRPDLTAYLGQTVDIVIDRPLGSRHPRHPDIVYPVNYGEVPGTISGDGMPIDVYLLGIDAPVERAMGTVIAVVLRADDVEDKLVATADGRAYTAEEIARLVQFQEQYVDSAVVVTRGATT